MDENEPFYTEQMRADVASVHNELNFPIDIIQLSDEEGPYLAVTFRKTTYDDIVGTDRRRVDIAAHYIVDLLRVLRAHDIRVTYWVVE